MYIGSLSLIAAEMVLYFSAMLALFSARRVIGLATFFCALAATQFLETQFAIGLYLKLPFGLALTPGAAALFSGKLALLLLVFVREGGPLARQPLYGMLFGNLLIFVLVALLAVGYVRQPVPQTLDVMHFAKMLALMVWGSALLVLECLGMFVLHATMRERWRLPLWLTLTVPLALALTFDQLLYFSALHFAFGIPDAAGFGTWAGRMVAALLYGSALTWYLTRIEPVEAVPGRTAAEILRQLRQPEQPQREPRRYDPLTGTFHASQFASICGHLLSVTGLTGRPMSLLLVHIDTPDREETSSKWAEMIRQASATIGEATRSGDYVVRYRDDAFAILAPGAPHHAAMQVAALLWRDTEAMLQSGNEDIHAVSIGVATTPQDGASVADLLSAAESRLAEARQNMGSRVVGSFAR